MDNEEPIFIACSLRIAWPPRVIKEKHIRLQLHSNPNQPAISAIGFNCAEKVQALQLAQDSRIDLAYKIRKNDHPDFGGLELEIADLRLTQTR
jgi:single-stranded-DNA-specific exonuclease